MSWWSDGLRFECQPDCGRCCSKERDGEVFVEPSDIHTLARVLGLPVHDFHMEFVARNQDDELVLRLAADGDCVFLHEGACRVYSGRPLQCRTYPFLPLDGFSPVETPWTWEREKEFCPGIDRGRLHSTEEIARIQRGRAPALGFEV